MWRAMWCTTWYAMWRSTWRVMRRVTWCWPGADFSQAPSILVRVARSAVCVCVCESMCMCMCVCLSVCRRCVYLFVCCMCVSLFVFAYVWGFMFVSSEHAWADVALNLCRGCSRHDRAAFRQRCGPKPNGRLQPPSPARLAALKHGAPTFNSPLCFVAAPRHFCLSFMFSLCLFFVSPFAMRFVCLIVVLLLNLGLCPLLCLVIHLFLPRSL